MRVEMQFPMQGGQLMEKCAGHADSIPCEALDPMRHIACASQDGPVTQGHVQLVSRSVCRVLRTPDGGLSPAPLRVAACCSDDRAIHIAMCMLMRSAHKNNAHAYIHATRHACTSMRMPAHTNMISRSLPLSLFLSLSLSLSQNTYTQMEELLATDIIVV